MDKEALPATPLTLVSNTMDSDDDFDAMSDGSGDNTLEDMDSEVSIDPGEL